jgi:hypothetical protein
VICLLSLLISRVLRLLRIWYKSITTVGNFGVSVDADLS